MPTLDELHRAHIESLGTCVGSAAWMRCAELLMRSFPTIYAAAKAAQRWTPVAEGLPDPGEDVLVCNEDDLFAGLRIVVRRIVDADRDRWLLDTGDGLREVRNVTAWMKLPPEFAAAGVTTSQAKQPQPERAFPLLGYRLSIPWSALTPHEHVAIRNHGQDLEKLASRGGLSPLEALCVIQGLYPREARGAGEEWAVRALKKLTTVSHRGSNDA